MVMRDKKNQMFIALVLRLLTTPWFLSQEEVRV
ncbi:hypothetical protein SAMN05421852_11029 [Thermoflavimicrobium dichotomicum]|uniref:Uncharacterized protein n=1 Tax=Thermoflavimicrobium dichotomicum TaxID=46223 RepID=A0A1I3RKS8_9BACL|nr:hypothetical protein SAMN05421852_11029 [Thermoflavimicrobium dichotomicum]